MFCVQYFQIEGEELFLVEEHYSCYMFVSNTHQYWERMGKTIAKDTEKPRTSSSHIRILYKYVPYIYCHLFLEFMEYDFSLFCDRYFYLCFFFSIFFYRSLFSFFCPLSYCKSSTYILGYVWNVVFNFCVQLS